MAERDWKIYRGDGKKDSERIKKLPAAPPWREFAKARQRKVSFLVEPEEIELVNAALYLRRPLLLTGQPGTGKSTLAYAVAEELELGEVLVWPINSHSTLKEALYNYDAIGRLQSGQTGDDIGQYVRLGPLGTAFADSDRLRVLLIDEIDKSDIDLPNDLLHIFETGQFIIPELARHAQPDVEVYKHDSRDSKDRVKVTEGQVLCRKFPFVVLTSNRERELPAPFLRRCLHLHFDEPNKDKLARVVNAHFEQTLSNTKNKVDDLIKDILHRRESNREYVATDQLLNAVYLIEKGVDLPSSLSENKPSVLLEAILQKIGETERRD